MTPKEDNTPVVSIIVPCYNNGKYLAETLDSVRSQTYLNWECLIIDDGLKDDTRNVAEQFVKRDKRYKYIYQENKGVSNARNSAIKQSAGKYILPLDGDDKISPEYIADAINVFGSDKMIKLVYCKAETFGTRNGYWCIPPYSYKGLLIENLIFCSALFKREDFLKTKGYDETMSEGFEDWEFWISFLAESDKVVQLPKVCFYYRLKGISRNPKTDDKEKQMRIRNYVFQKHKDIFQKYFPLPDIIFDYYVSSSELRSIRDSNSYRIGKAILQPLWLFKRLFK